MSSIPKAKRSTISGLVVEPDNWDSYPTVEYSHIDSCRFEGLNSNTRFERSRFTNVNINSDGTAKSRIERSILKDSEIRHSSIERSEIRGTKMSDAVIERSRFTLVTVTGPKARIERSIFDQCDIKGKCKIERTNMKEVLLEETSMETVNINSSFVTKSRIERSNITDCDIGDCKIERTNFTGMYLRNGIWKRGDLVGRVDKTREVIIKPKSEMPPPPMPSNEVSHGRNLLGVAANEKSQPEDLLTGPSTVPRSEYPPDIKAPLEPTPEPTAPSMSVNEKELEWSDAGMVTPPSPSHSTATGLLDEEIARQYIRDDYDGPEIESLPPYDEINPSSRTSTGMY
jgi:uncharacterized protein YjbI with pentapeptide repeats